MKVTIHDGKLNRYVVEVECKTPHPKIRQAYDGLQTEVWVFAATPGEARGSAIEKMQDRWLRHQDLVTEWSAHNVQEG